MKEVVDVKMLGDETKEREYQVLMQSEWDVV